MIMGCWHWFCLVGKFLHDNRSNVADIRLLILSLEEYAKNLMLTQFHDNPFFDSEVTDGIDKQTDEQLYITFH
jgi:hypothetical protein